MRCQFLSRSNHALQTYDVAARLASVLISLMVIYAGYMIPVNTMKRWLFWIYYINPLSYGESHNVAIQ